MLTETGKITRTILSTLLLKHMIKLFFGVRVCSEFSMFSNLRNARHQNSIVCLWNGFAKL